MTRPTKSKNVNYIKKYSELKNKILHIIKNNQEDLKDRSVTPKITPYKYLYRNVIKENAGYINEWKQWLFQNVTVNVCGQNITGILIEINTDHLTLVSELDIYIIPIQHVTYISYRSH